MNVIVNIDFKQLGKDADLKIKKGLNEILKMLKEYALKESPIDTGEYNSNHVITNARDDGKTILGMLENKTPYAEILEYGVMGRTYNYHRYGKTYMSGIGARVYTRTQDNNLRNMEAILSKNLSFK